VQWNPIPRNHVHGILLGYRVFYQDYEYRLHSKNIITNNTQMILKDLLPGMYYSIAVYGFTVKGEGPGIGTGQITSKSMI
jgi:hypothetical protein